MCSNADWVIDADVFNLGLGTGGVMQAGQSNEANPSKTPTPAQSGITASTPETYWDGALSAWAVDLVKLGYTVETLPYNKTVTYGNTSNAQDLSHYKVFISDEPNILFSAAEKTALIQFVQNGGGLFMIGDHTGSDRNFDGYDSPQIWNDLMNNNSVQAHPFGMSFDSTDYSQTSSNVANLPSDSCLHNAAIGNVTQIKISGGSTLTLSTAQNSSVRGLIYKTGVSNSGTTNAFFARSRFGNGKVAALTDSSPPDDGTGDPNDNLYFSYTGEVNGNHRVLLLNTTIWLAATDTVVHTGIDATTADETSFVVFPNPVTDKLSVRCSGLNSNTELKIFDVSGTEIYSRVLENRFEGIVSIDTKDFATGVYFLKLNSVVKRFVKSPQ